MVKTLHDMDKSNSEYHKISTWINGLCKIPFGNYIELPVNKNSSIQEIYDFISQTKTHFDSNIHGHILAKDNILRILAQWITNPSSKGNVIGICGSPGVGKTTLAKDCISKVLHRPFISIPLGGASDSSYLDGFSYTYEGATWGRIVDSLMKIDCMNPVLYFDELDKVSESWRGDEIINTLIHLTDPSQNTEFVDKYYNNIKFDLSKCIIIFTYNNSSRINPILKDRMIEIQAKDYNIEDKLIIAKNHLIPSLCQQFSFKPNNIIIDDETLTHIIHKTDSEAGVRNLKRSLECILSNLNLKELLESNTLKNNQYNIQITRKVVDTYLITNKNIDPSLSHIYL